MILAIESLSKAFGGLRVVDDVSLTVPDGGLVGVIGPNGAGKSTLFSLVTGFVAADAGDVTLDGRSVANLPASGRARAGMVRTFQVPREFAHLTVRENLMAAAPEQSGERLFDLFFRPAAVREQEEGVRRQAAGIIEFLRLTAVADTPAGRLSGGQKKLLELGRALMTGARLILLDEPFAGVNPLLIEEISQRIRDLNERGIGFLIIEHDLGALTRLVTTLHAMDRGCLIATGTPDAVLSDPRVREAYLGGAA
jgi:branched-chain amino acid transport system ATP-binding protein